MGKSISDKLAESKKWLDKNGQSSLNLKSAQAALANAEKSVAELASLKAKLREMIEDRDNALLSLEDALEKVRTEKRLRAKDAKLQAKLAALAGPAK
jgi:DNA repair ATPase RecN